MAIKFLNDVAVDSNVLYVDTINNRVGIGTVNPGGELEVKGAAPSIVIRNSTFGSGESTLEFRTAMGATNKLAQSSANDLNFKSSGGSSLFTIKNGGNIGINTTNPNQKLDVDGNIQLAQYGYIYFGSNSSNQLLLSNSLSGAQITQTGSGNLGLQSASNHIDLIAGGLTTVRVRSSGNVGIGITNPSQKLDVSGNIKMTETAALSYTGNKFVVLDSGVLKYRTGAEVRSDIGAGTGNGDITSVTAGTNLTGGGTSGAVTLDMATGGIGSGTYGNTANGTKIDNITVDAYGRVTAITTGATGSGNGTVTGSGNANYVSKWTSGTAQGNSTIYDDGDVGIGTTSPSEKFTLQTQATGLGSEGIFIKNPFAGTSPIVNSKSPFLSLGTSTNSAYNSTIYMGRNATATDQESKIEWSNANNGLSIYVKGQGTYREHVRFGNLSSSTPRTYFGGNVGIGATSPATKLEVEGGDALIQLSTTSSTGSPYLSFAQAGTRRSFIQHADSGDTLKIASEYGGIDFYTGTSGTETEKMTIESGGDVGIGTTNPTQKLHINGGNLLVAGDYNSFYVGGITNSFQDGIRMSIDNSGNGYIDHRGAGSLRFRVDNSQGANTRMVIESGGDVGIGTTDPGCRLSVVDASTTRTWSDYFATVATFERNSDSNINIVSSNTGNGAIWFGDTDSMVRGRIRYAHNGDEMSFWVSAASRATLDSSGDLAITGTLSQNSDIVLKENVEDIDGALEKVKQLRGVEFNMIGNDKKQLGVIAQEIEKVLPELVTQKDDIRSVAYGNITAVLIEAIKEQQTQIDELKNQVELLKK